MALDLLLLLSRRRDVEAKELDTTADLRYLEADSVCCAAGKLADFRVRTQDEKTLGSVRGVLISPATRRCEFFVIQSPGLFSPQRYLLPVEAGAVVEQPRTLKIHARKDELHLQSFTPSSVPEFSDDDLVRTVFAA